MLLFRWFSHVLFGALQSKNHEQYSLLLLCELQPKTPKPQLITSKNYCCFCRKLSNPTLNPSSIQTVTDGQLLNGGKIDYSQLSLHTSDSQATSQALNR